MLVALVLFASGPFIQQAVTGPNWKEACQKQKDRAEVAESSARNALAMSQVNKTQYESLLQSVKSKADTDRGVLSAKDVEISRLTGQLADRAGEVQKLSAFNEAFEKSLDAQINLNKDLMSQLDAVRTENMKLSDHLRRAQSTLKEMQTIGEGLEKSNKVLQEQLAQRDKEIEQLNSGETKVGSSTAIASKVRIDGTIIAVKGDIASMNVGSASGVKKDMEFTVYRDTNFVAHIRIADVGVADSTGIILDRTRDPQVGDKASTNLE